MEKTRYVGFRLPVKEFELLDALSKKTSLTYRDIIRIGLSNAVPVDLLIAVDALPHRQKVNMIIRYIKEKPASINAFLIDYEAGDAVPYAEIGTEGI
jgi:hypothetical protein